MLIQILYFFCVFGLTLACFTHVWRRLVYSSSFHVSPCTKKQSKHRPLVLCHLKPWRLNFVCLLQCSYMLCHEGKIFFNTWLFYCRFFASTWFSDNDTVPLWKNFAEHALWECCFTAVDRMLLWTAGKRKHISRELLCERNISWNLSLCLSICYFYILPI